MPSEQSTGKDQKRADQHNDHRHQEDWQEYAHRSFTLLAEALLLLASRHSTRSRTLHLAIQAVCMLFAPLVWYMAGGRNRPGVLRLYRTQVHQRWLYVWHLQCVYEHLDI